MKNIKLVKMRNINIQIKIIILFGTVFLMSFIPDNYPQYFGDWQCNGNWYENGSIKGNCNYLNFHYPTIHWGWRHWIWAFCGISLFIYNGVKIIKLINKENK